MTFKSAPNTTSLVIIISVCVGIWFISHCDSQFISHINAKGLKGNVTFTAKEDSNGSELLIEAILETDSSIWPIDSDQELDETILFGWSLHSNVLYPQALFSCSRDDLGPVVSDNLRESLSTNRTIILNQQNKWAIDLKKFLLINNATSLSSLIWGKSIRLALYRPGFDEAKSSQQQSEKTPSLASNSSSAAAKAPRPRPNLPVFTPATEIKPPLGKPTFAPRPKPSISSRAKPTFAPSRHRPKREVSLAINGTIPQNLTESVQNVTVPRNSSEVIQILTLPRNSLEPIPVAAPPEKSNKYKRIIKILERVVVCGNIIETRDVKSAEAIFESQVAGKVSLRGNEDDTTIITTNLYHVKSKVTTRHDWKILASDILDNSRHAEKCRYLQVIFDPKNVDDTNCTKAEPHKCRIGDLVRKHGQIQVAGQGRNTRSSYVDLNLPIATLEGSRALFLVIYEVSSTSQQRANILSCAQINSVKSRRLEASFNMDGVRGTIKMSQRYFTEPTIITYDLFGLEGNIKHQSIKELPLPMRTSSDNSKLCTSLGEIFDPLKITATSKRTTVDAFPVGNLSAKHGPLSVIDSEYEDHYMGEHLDLTVQLFGINSVMGRSIVMHKNNGEPWVCSTLNIADEPVSLAVANFHYPVVGKISFQQVSNDPHSETGVLVEVYNPNGERDGINHNWMVHLKPAMADFYNWSERCESSGEVYDPVQVATGLTGEIYSRQCQVGMMSEPLRCRSGDIALKSGYKLSLPLSHLNRTRFFYTDLFLPINGLNSIIGRSVVIYDDNAPKQRGNRLACSTIKLVHPLKASIKSWNSGPSIPSNVLGTVVFDQESAQSATRLKIDLTGFNGNVEHYAIHNVWTMDDREFPCSNDSLYDIYDPYDNENSLRLPPSAHYGSLATVDRVKVGDMSRKHGTFEGLQSAQRSFIDANAPLFAPRSIIGRSMVLRAAVNDFRWVCGNIELDYDRGESRELIGMASFDEPRSKIAGYVRFFQLEHKDGSLSDTYVHIDLRLQADGVHELQTSESHNWAVFVNQVGEDAFIAADEVRCIASGFKWNPYLAQDTLETYPSACTPNEPHACAMGDLGMRHGPLVLGPNNRRAISDSNLPLVGNYSVMGRSLIIFDNKRPTVKLACANIMPDIHLKSNVVIKRTPSFTVARFVEQMRTLLGAAEWLLVPELKATKPVANGECVQMTIHFYGQKAHQMQVELNNLITLGTVRKSTRIGSDKISTHYKLCRTGQMQLTSSSSVLIVNLITLKYLLIITTLIVNFCTRK